MKYMFLRLHLWDCKQSCSSASTGLFPVLFFSENASKTPIKNNIQLLKDGETKLYLNYVFFLLFLVISYRSNVRFIHRYESCCLFLDVNIQYLFLANLIELCLLFSSFLLHVFLYCLDRSTVY